MTVADNFSSTLRTLSATRSSALIAADTASIRARASAFTASDAIGTTFDARNNPSGSDKVTSPSCWMRGSALYTLAMSTIPATSDSTVVSPVASKDTVTPYFSSKPVGP